MSTLPDEFMQPAAPGGDKLDLNTLNGSLLIFEVQELVEHVQTVHTQPGEKTPAIRADVHVVDGPNAGTTRKDALVFAKVLQAQLRPAVGRKVLGRLRKGIPKPGMPAPWELAEATDADRAAGHAFLSQPQGQPQGRPQGQPAQASTFSSGSEAPF